MPANSNEKDIFVQNQKAVLAVFENSSQNYIGEVLVREYNITRDSMSNILTLCNLTRHQSLQKYYFS